jgi:hypothetical protein
MRGEWAGAVTEGTGWDWLFTVGGLTEWTAGDGVESFEYATAVPLHFEQCAARGVELGGEGLTHQPGGWGPVTLVQGVRARVGSNLNTERTGLGVAVTMFW